MCAIVSDAPARLSSSSEIGMVLYDQQARRLQWAARDRQSGSQAARDATPPEILACMRNAKPQAAQARSIANPNANPNKAAI